MSTGTGKVGGHTPGPWHVGYHATAEAVRYIKSGGFFPVEIAVLYDGHEANARLIAESPALLEAGRAALDYLNRVELGLPVGESPAAQLAAAIARATGAEP